MKIDLFLTSWIFSNPTLIIWFISLPNLEWNVKFIYSFIQWKLSQYMGQVPSDTLCFPLAVNFCSHIISKEAIRAKIIYNIFLQEKA